MQTEDIEIPSLDNGLHLNHPPEIAMTVKEEETCDSSAPGSPASRSSLHDSTINVRDAGASQTPPQTQDASSGSHPDRGRGRGRRRSRWKLKFHHQALPPEYLDHYEAAMAQQDAAAAKSCQSSKQQRPVPPLVPRRPPVIKLEPEAEPVSVSPLTATASAIEKLQIVTVGDSFSCRPHSGFPSGSEVLTVNERTPLYGRKDANKKHSNNKGLLGSLLASTCNTTESELSNRNPFYDTDCRRSSVIMSSGVHQNTAPSSSSTSRSDNPGVNNTANKIVSYQDLPYMGEITLDNMKPRRGRKPKKADICHLIYKNYGTVFPGMPHKYISDGSDDWCGKGNMPQDSAVSPPSTDVIGRTLHSVTANPEQLPLSNSKCTMFDSLKSAISLNHTDVQSRIINSLLEKRLTAASQEVRKQNVDCSDILQQQFGNSELEYNVDEEHWSKKSVASSTTARDEPLNLCIKDLNQLKIRLLRKHDNFYEPKVHDVITVKSEPPSPTEAEQTDVHETIIDSSDRFAVDSGNEDKETKVNFALQGESLSLGEGLPLFPSPLCTTNPSSTSVFPFDPTIAAAAGAAPPLPGGYMYWPSTGVFVHPMALQSQLLYYQKIGAIPIVPIAPEQSQAAIQPQVNVNPHPSTAPPSPQTSPVRASVTKEKSGHSKVFIPKAFSMMMDASRKTSSPTSSESSFSRMKRLAPLGNPPPPGAPTKRKRSAIFIPPMPSENSTNPTTEVSICKFKFTGGAKPTLQEKKMLSVDSGGNFRYYSGTGDKSMRGYEFFPRESLQQSSATATASASEHFLAAASTLGSNDRTVSHKDSFTQGTFPPDKPHIQQYPTSSDLLVKEISGTDMQSSYQGGSPFSIVNNADNRYKTADTVDDHSSQFSLSRRKRKTRKSLAREKLEQTFKEKGFLIQTQQLESAEGATYCKFRQLRKFTRYLFRSWKDYLPGNVREMSIAAGVSGADNSPHNSPEVASEGELSSSNPASPATTQELPEHSSGT